MITPQEIKNKLLVAFPEAQIQVADLTGGGDHYKAILVWNGFESLSLIERHRRVNAALAEELKGAIHALSIEAYTPSQWSQKQ